MPTLREQMEGWPEGALFNHMAEADLDSHAGRAVAAELQRRRLIEQRQLEAAQIGAAQAQINAANDTAASLKAVRTSVFWTAVAAIATAISAGATIFSLFHLK